MGSKKPFLSFPIENKFLQEIDDYQFDCRFKSRAAAIRHLIRIGLKIEKKKKGDIIKQKVSAIKEGDKKPFLPFHIEEGLLQEIDDFRFEGRFESRTEAIKHLIRVGLTEERKSVH